MALLSACSGVTKNTLQAPQATPPDNNYWYDPQGTPSTGSGEQYSQIVENPVVSTADETTVTFSLKVDTAAYSNVARYINSGNLPPKDAVRTEELINYFQYDQPLPVTDGPFGIYTEIGPSPFDRSKYMAFIRVKTADIDKSALPPSNLTFLIDTSGSMSSYDKLPLLKSAFGLLVDTLGENDTVSIVTYAGNAGVALDSASGADKARIMDVIDSLESGGSTGGAGGIQAAYALAEKNFKKDGNNRIILATDGDFNVGISDTDSLGDLVLAKRGDGIYLSVLGFGTGNIRDDIMETLSQKGNGNYSYIDSLSTAQKVLVDEMGSNLYTVADDVKTQVEFNPASVTNYRLIGYENREMSNSDFANDDKGAGNIGVGTDVVVMFEITLADNPDNTLFTLNVRYKDPGQDESRLIAKPVNTNAVTQAPGTDFRFACAVAAFGHLLRGSEYTGQVTPALVMSMAQQSLGQDKNGYRREFISLLTKYRQITGT